MADTNAPPPILPAHLEETIGSITRLHAEHHQNATRLQRAVDRVTALLGRPGFIGVLTIIVVGWMSLNLLAAALGYRPIDPPPFSGLGSAVSLVSLYMVVLILATQVREDQLAQHAEEYREHAWACERVAQSLSSANARASRDDARGRRSMAAAC